MLRIVLNFFGCRNLRLAAICTFILRRVYYYEGEKNGWWKLVRLRKRGTQRGVTIVPFDQVAAFVRKQMENTK